MNILNHTVDVKYKIIKISNSKALDEIDEVYKMRFLFSQEVKLICDVTGSKVLELCPFIKLGKMPTEKDWNVTGIARMM